MDLRNTKIAIIGLGYVGLPLAVEFGKVRPVLGFDVNKRRIDELRSGIERTGEVEPEELASAAQLAFSSDPKDLGDCGIFIVTVPTPIDKANRPDLSPLRGASETVGAHMPKGAVVIYESTVYPGCTRDYCVPILEARSGGKADVDFFTGYSPERINPGDKEHRLVTIRKVTSGSTPEAAEAVDALYASIIKAGTYKAASIEVAEAAKVIENTQRDINIALINELSMIFHRLGIDTLSVLEAAGTKWNFLPFRPGLVGGHCIGVDPYYLTHRAAEVGYHPEVILAGRRINDAMGPHVADRVARLMMRRSIPVSGGRILVMGLAFKENCPDLRNSKVVDILAEFADMNALVDVWDPWVDADEAEHEYGVRPIAGDPREGVYDAVVLAVGHRQFKQLGAASIRQFGKPNAVFFDVKSVFGETESDGRL